MPRTRIVYDVSTGQASTVPYTASEETIADAVKAADDLVQGPIIAEQARLSAIRLNARTIVIVNALMTKDDVGLISAIAARYPALTGDGLKAVTDIALALATIYRA